MRFNKPNFRLKESSTVKLLKHLVRIPSVNPLIEEGDGEKAISNFIAEWFRKTKRFEVFEQKVSNGRVNVIATLHGKGKGRSMMLNGHLDTVGTSYMTVNPFRPVTRNGRIYGRGSCDMKGSLAAMMSAVLAIADLNEPLAGDVVFTGVVDEEQGSRGMARLVKDFRSDSAIVGEPTNLDVAVAHKGYAWLEIETFGKEAHGSVPERGIDAIEKASKLVNGLEMLRRRYRLKKHRLLGTAKIHSSMITGGTDWSTVPGKCVLKVERRLIPGERPEDAANEFRYLIRQASRGDKDLRANVRLVHHADSMEVNVKEPVVQLLLEQVRGLQGRGRIIGVPYWTDAAILVNQAKIPTCIFGPGDIKFAHSKDENVRIADVMTAARTYAGVACRYCAEPYS